MPEVGFDSRAVLIGGERRLLLSGAIHYPRSTPGMWPDLLRRSREAGLNTIETYVFWNLHEHQRGCYDFSGRLDLEHFLELCQAEGMQVILRVGPYICAETNYGGLPPWLLDIPGLVTRTENEAFQREMLGWCKVLMAKVGRFQATAGGPVILIQLENEYNNVAKRYGAVGARYMDWVTGLREELGVTVPLIMCEGSAEGAIETLNGFAVAERVAELRERRPQQPALWTECWTGWYDVWSEGHHVRDTRALIYHILRFFAAGGTGINYYMWHGGTNFARDAMFQQTTSYDFDAPLDEYGLPTAKYKALRELHGILAQYSAQLLAAPGVIATLVPHTDSKELPLLFTARFGTAEDALIIAVNGQPHKAAVQVAKQEFTLAADSAGMIAIKAGTAEMIFSSDRVRVAATTRKWEPVAALKFSCRAEPLASTEDWAEVKPGSMLPLTRDLTDYGWYRFTIRSEKKGEAVLALDEVRDRSLLFVNGAYIGAYPERLEENASRSHWRHEYRIPLKRGVNEVRVLVSACGLIKGDWMIDAPQSEERKGLIGAFRVDGRRLALKPQFRAGLAGEAARWFDPAVAACLLWEPVVKINDAPELRWFRAEFALSKRKRAGYAFDAGGLMKGMLWLNGRCLGRYWQLPVMSADNPETWHCGHATLATTVGEPVQRHYHLPIDWLADMNTLIVFEESATKPLGTRIVCRA